jgi:hypothetical protein
MPSTTWEDAKRCPKCGNPGNDSVVTPLGNGSKIHTIYCENPTCRWYETSWIVQVMADGSIPVRKPGEKDYPELSPGVAAAAQRQLDTLRAAETGDEDAAHELLPGGQIQEVDRRGR